MMDNIIVFLIILLLGFMIWAVESTERKLNKIDSRIIYLEKKVSNS